jgi:hypothetical protein
MSSQDALLGVCKRPLQGDLGSFQPLYNDSTSNPVPGIGDPSYGYVINPDLWWGSYGCPSGTTLVTSLPSGYYAGPTTSQCQFPQGGSDPVGVPVYCPIGYLPSNPAGCSYPWIPAGCAALMPNVNIAENESPVMCAGSWTTQASTANKILGCSGLSFSSSQVLPDACPANTEWCPSFMAGVCTPDAWASTANNACDVYATSARGVPSAIPGLDASAALILEALRTWSASGGKPTDNTPFIAKAIKWCGQYPGVCDEVLTGACSSYSSKDLSPANYSGRSYDPHGTNALQMCGCFLPASQYVKPLATQCNATCAFPGAIPLSSNGPSVQGPPAQCSTTECAIDDVVVDYINSPSAAITLSQVCGKPTNNACYFNGISANDPQDPDLQFQITTTCSTCFDYNPATYQATQVTCPTSAKSVKKRLTSASTREGWAEWAMRWRWWILAALAATGVCYIYVKRT